MKLGIYFCLIIQCCVFIDDYLVHSICNFIFLYGWLRLSILKKKLGQLEFRYLLILKYMEIGCVYHINVYVQLLNLPVGFIFTFTSFRVVGKYVHHPLVQIGRWKNMKYQEKKTKKYSEVLPLSQNKWCFWFLDFLFDRLFYSNFLYKYYLFCYSLFYH